MTKRSVKVELTSAGGITVEPWLVAPVNPDTMDSIDWSATRCKIKIESDHPEHFKEAFPDKYRGRVKLSILPSVPNGTYKYRVSVLENPQKLAEVAVYSVDPDYKVDR